MVGAAAEEACGKACEILAFSGSDEARVEVTVSNVLLDGGESGRALEFKH